MGNNGRILQHLAAQAATPPPQQLVIHAMNDLQLVSLLAVRLVEESTPERAVATACEIIAEAVVQLDAMTLAKLIEAKKAKQTIAPA